jgi:SAM-dependent methyltransferase
MKAFIAYPGGRWPTAIGRLLHEPRDLPQPSPFLDVPFPLNVYAHLLLLVQGETKYLHYGLFASPGDELTTAQIRSNALLREWLPAPPARILEVGMGLGTFAAELADAGYEVVAISPDEAQVKLADKMAAERPNLSVRALAFEQMPGRSDGPFDVVLLQESAQYIGLNDLFHGAAALLREHGRLILIDEVALGRSADGLQNLHLLADIKTHAQRLGFSLAYEQDLSREAAPTVDFLLEHLARLRDPLIRALRLDPAALDDLQTALQAYRAEYAVGRFGYVALSFTLP